MNKITSEEGKLWITEPSTVFIWGHKFTKEEFDKLVMDLKPPTLDEVVNAWEEDEDMEVISHYDDIIKVRRKGTSIIEYHFKSLGVEVRTGIVYSKHQKAYDLTIRYLESQREEEQ